MLKINGLNLNEEFYNYFLQCCDSNGINSNRLSLIEFKALVNTFKENWRHNKQK